MKFTTSFRPKIAVGIALAACAGLPGCTGMNQSVSQSLGMNSGTRVPPPATGSYATPNSYTGNGAASPQVQVPQQPGISPGQAAPNATSYFNPLTQPTNQIVNSINNAQNQFNQATEQARNSVVQTADNLNNRLNTASERIDRFNQGVTQASAIMQDAIQAPAPVQSVNPPATHSPATHSAVGSGASNMSNPNEAWRKPNL